MLKNKDKLQFGFGKSNPQFKNDFEMEDLKPYLTSKKYNQFLKKYGPNYK